MANNTEQELRDEVTKIVTLSRVFNKNKLTPEPVDAIMALIEAEATRARIDELERINPTTEWTQSAEYRQVTIGERMLELKRQLEGEQ